MAAPLRRAAVPATAVLALLAPALPAAAPAAGLVAVTVGGGPKPSLNQVAIESNVRYVDGLLPAGAERTVLFGDGKPDSPIVLYQEPSAAPAPDVARPAAERALEALFGPAPSVAGGDDASAPGGGGTGQKLRAPRLRAIDGPSRRESIAAAFDRVAALPGEAPYLVYFTGHGDRTRADLDNNTYALWAENKGLAVRELAAEVAKLPKGRPVTLIMVQCYSGAFANVLFEGGDP